MPELTVAAARLSAAVRYDLKQAPQCIVTGTYGSLLAQRDSRDAAAAAAVGAGGGTDSAAWPHIALAPDGYIVAVATGGAMGIFDASTGALLESMRNAHGGASILDLKISSDSRLLATAGRDRCVRVWDNLPGLRAAVAQWQARLSGAASESQRRLLGQQIADAQRRLASKASMA